MTVEGKIDFIGNNVENFDGGALYVTSYGQVVLDRGAEITFVGNQGLLGSAMVVETQLVVSSLSKTGFNPQCFLLYRPDGFLSPLDWEEVRN